MLKEFKEFVMRGNMLDLAVGIVLGVAFGAIIASLVSDVLMPPIGLLVGGMDFKDLFMALDGKTYASLAAAKEAGAPVVSEYDHQLPDRGVRDLPTDQASEQNAEAGPRADRARNEGMPVLPQHDRIKGNALPALHFRSRARHCCLAWRTIAKPAEKRKRRCAHRYR
jgi:hypothetical protein